jgi:hypothetical protein
LQLFADFHYLFRWLSGEYLVANFVCVREAL